VLIYLFDIIYWFILVLYLSSQYLIGSSSSQDFDVTLMVCLLRNLTHIAPPVNGFDVLPSSQEKSIGADLARIKFYRNRLAHSDDDKISTIAYNTAVQELTGVRKTFLIYLPCM
jgi:hypothetical protein